MRRFICFTAKSELERLQQDKHPCKSVRQETREIEGTEREIRTYIGQLCEKGNQVHFVMLKEHCEHCGGHGYRKVRDIKFDVPERTR